MTYSDMSMKTENIIKAKHKKWKLVPFDTLYL